METLTLVAFEATGSIVEHACSIILSPAGTDSTNRGVCCCCVYDKTVCVCSLINHTPPVLCSIHTFTTLQQHSSSVFEGKWGEFCHESNIITHFLVPCVYFCVVSFNSLLFLLLNVGARKKWISIRKLPNRLLPPGELMFGWMGGW